MIMPFFPDRKQFNAKQKGFYQNVVIDPNTCALLGLCCVHTQVIWSSYFKISSQKNSNVEESFSIATNVHDDLVALQFVPPLLSVSTRCLTKIQRSVLL